MDHFRLKYDKDHLLANYTNLFQDLYDIDDQILAISWDLFSVISDIPEVAEGGVSCLEAGLLI
jgi:hypothetical protein